jgi:protein SCO1
MTSSTRVRLAFVLYLSALAMSFLTGCARRVEPAERMVSDTSGAAREESFSVYDLGSSWRDQTGATRPLTSLRGKQVVMAMIYTHCAAVCPLSVSEMKRIEAKHPEVQLVLVSLDPAQDSPQRLAAYAVKRGLSSSRWMLLNGNEADVRDLAATIGVRYRRISADDLAHSNILTLLDGEGRVARQGTGVMDDDAILALRQSAR